MEYVLKINNLNKTYGSQLVLDNINMEIKKGAIYGFIGRNGAGKSTLMRTICGLAEADSGELELFGTGLKGNIRESRKRIGVVIENPTLHKGLTAQENLEIQRRLLNVVGKERVDEVLNLVGLGQVGKKKVRAFSLGMKQRLAMALALLNQPEFLILDEPINGLDPMGVVEMRNTIKDLANQGVTIMISSHILSELHLLATDFGIIEQGRLVKQLSATELDEACQHYIELKTSDDEKSFHILTDKLGSVVKQETENLIVTDVNLPTEEIISVLTNAGIGIKAINNVDQDLESYFISVIGAKGGHQYV